MKNSYSYVDGIRSLPDYDAFDPYEDFCQFMEEGKQHAQEAGSQRLEPEKEKLAADQKQVKGTKSKKSWKASSLISWLKGGKSGANPSSNLTVLKPKTVSVSGPVYSSEGSDCIKPKRQLSGPLNGLFTPLKKADTMKQYTSLPKPNSRNGPYGPMYTVV